MSHFIALQGQLVYPGTISVILKINRAYLKNIYPELFINIFRETVSCLMSINIFFIENFMLLFLLDDKIIVFNENFYEHNWQWIIWNDI